MENNKKHKRFQEITLSDLQNIEYEIAKNDKSAIEILVRPRSFFLERGFLLPALAKITVLSTEEKRARLNTQEGLREFLTIDKDPTYYEGKIKNHVMDGLAKCVTIYIDCPCAKARPASAEGGKDILSEMTLQDFYSIVTEAEKNDKLIDELILNPRGYFETKGFFASQGVRISAIHSTEWLENLNNELKINRFLNNDESPLSKVYHISEGKGKCTHVEVTCDCKK